MVRGFRSAISAGAAVVIGLVVLAVAPASASNPTISLASTTLVPGRQVAVHGRGWPAGTQVQLQVCGQGAVDGSADCAQDSALTISPAGRFGDISGMLLVELPPAPCPCVVLVQSLPDAYTTSLPVRVVGARIDRVPATPQPRLTVQARLTGRTSLASLFGLRAHRTLALTIKNSGGTVETFPVISAGWGRSTSNLSAISVPPVAPLPPGRTVQITIPFTLDPLSVGRYVVAGSVAGGVQPVAYEVKTSTIPWGLFAVGLVVLVAAIIFIGKRVRARLARRRATKGHREVDVADDTAPIPLVEPGPTCSREGILPG